MREQRSGISASASGFIEILESAAIWGSLASVIIAFLKARHSRRVLITTKDGQTLSAEGLTHKELEWVVAHAKTMTAIETKSETSEP